MKTAQEHKKRLGRPAKAPTPGERVALGLKVTAEIKQRLDRDARKSGRTQSQQAELMIERAYGFETSFGDPEMAQVALLMVSAFATAGRLSAAGKDQWINDPNCYLAGLIGVVDALLIGFPNATAEDVARVIEVLRGRLLSRFASEKEQDK